MKAADHAALVKAALDAKKMVFCEWPLGVSVAEAEVLAAHARAADVRTFVGLQARFALAVQRARELVAQGYVGTVLSTTLSGSGMAWGANAERAHAYWFDARSGANTISVPTMHALEAMTYVLGELATVAATSAIRRSTVMIDGTPMPVTAPDHVSISGQLVSGAIASVTYRGDTSRAGNLRWEINGTEGDLLITAENGNLQVADLIIAGGRGADTGVAMIELPVVDANGFGANTLREYAAIARDLRTGTKIVPDFAYALERHRLLAAIEKACELRHRTAGGNVKAIVQTEAGGADQLVLEELPAPSAGPGQVVVEIKAAGVNFMDIGTRLGMYSIGAFPTTPGVEGAGRVTAIGAGVTSLAVGDRVAWFFVARSYAEQVVGLADSFVRLPDHVDDETAASVMMQGLTALNFVRGTYKIQPGDTALVHAAAGGVGILLTQIITILGGRVIARVSTAAKAEVARRAGAAHVIVNPSAGFAEEVQAWSGGEGVHVVYDGSGADTFADSLASLRYHGVLAYYGQTIKRLPPIDLLDLPRSVLVTYPVVQHLVRTHAALEAHSNDLFGWLKQRKLHVEIGGRYPLGDAARAHRDLESRRTVGKLLLVP